ncbi:hypothetical protein CYMTET_54269 [Cymbomonas tetramitiformis]|uniref:Uncharacterized protein n=1 Tax=Cymbomonas tetramitiformis TaxID=36881 RepID=A0AAE0BFK9_9CHLO|nr:hypothetical protein CYMTET_54269 [Cymbomonas tetramitiformis]
MNSVNVRNIIGYNVSINVHNMPSWWLGDVSDVRCSVGCNVVKRKGAKADILMHYLNVPAYAYDHTTKHALVSLEGCYGEGCQNDPGNLARTDLLLSFDPRADFLTLYDHNRYAELPKPKVRYGARFGEDVVTSALHISNCHPFRIHVIQRLIDSGFRFFNYGSCRIPTVQYSARL